MALVYSQRFADSLTPRLFFLDFSFPKIIIKNNFILLLMYVVVLYTASRPGTCGGQEGVQDPLGLELRMMVNHEGIEN